MATANGTVIVKAYSGKEADTILAQAEGYKRIMLEILNGSADREHRVFLQSCKVISGEQSEKGA